MSKNDLTTHQFDIPKVLGDTNLLSAEDFTFLKDHSDQFEKRFRTRSLFRSKFEMEASVLNEDVHPTPDSKYWQAIGEQNVHITELISLSYQSKKMGKDLELKEIERKMIYFRIMVLQQKMILKKMKHIRLIKD